ncbi:hypothetical protein DL98DRAFT_434131, partial [Cadophora sp. DSE1049]
NVFFPGLTNISTTLQQLQASNSNSYNRILCICGLAVFFGKYTKNFFKILVATYFVLKVYISYSNKVYDILVAWVSS